MSSPESCLDIIDREMVSGGHSSATKEKLRIVVTEAGLSRERTLLLKRTSQTEAEALRAANLVSDATAIPHLLRSGQDADGVWIVTPFYSGRPAATEAAIPGSVADSLARLHARFLGSTPPVPIPTIQESWWSERCALARLRQLGRVSLTPIIDQVQIWADHPAILSALEELPRTLLHGDVHCNNVVVTDHDAKLVDWGGAKCGIPQFDLVTLGEGGRAYERYVRTWEAVTGESTRSAVWRRGQLTATVCINVAYLTFAARHFGDNAARRMFDKAVTAVTELERMGGS